MPTISLKPNAKGVTVLVIIAVIVFFGCVLTYMAMGGKLRHAASELQEREKQVDESKLIAQKLEKSKLDYVDARAQVHNLECSVSSQDYVPTLLKQIEAMGKSVNLKVNGVRPQAPDAAAVATKKLSSGADSAKRDADSASQDKTSGGKTAASAKPYDELKIALDVQGKYMDALAFIYKLTSFPKIIAVNTVEMSPKANDKNGLGSPNLTIKINVTAFILKNDKPDSDPEASANAAAPNNSPREGRTRNESG